MGGNPRDNSRNGKLVNFTPFTKYRIVAVNGRLLERARFWILHLLYLFQVHVVAVVMMTVLFGEAHLLDVAELSCA